MTSLARKFHINTRMCQWLFIIRIISTMEAHEQHMPEYLDEVLSYKKIARHSTRKV